MKATALWYSGPGEATLKGETLPSPGTGEALVRMLWSGVSRGTERLVFNGLVPEDEYDRMRAPLMGGHFPFPVKYGYAAVGVVEDGPPALTGRTVFCLHPHQDRFIAPEAMLTPLPEGLPARRAVLAANMETALNAVWDSGAGPGDRIVVVGAGIVGLLVTALVSRLPGAEVTLVDIDADRRKAADVLGVQFCAPLAAPTGADVVIHASTTPAGLAMALDAAGLEARVIELSWYGDRLVPAPLGGAFHSQRLQLISSQVGQIAPGRRPRWDYVRRRETALRLLLDDRLDVLISGECAFADLPKALPALLAPGAAGLQTAIRYG